MAQSNKIVVEFSTRDRQILERIARALEQQTAIFKNGEEVDSLERVERAYGGDPS